MKIKHIYVNAVLKQTNKRSLFLIKSNNPSITIKKGFDFSDTYKAAVIQSLDNIESNLLAEKKDPNKISYLQILTIEKYQLKFAKSIALIAGSPINALYTKQKQFSKDSLIATGKRRFIITENEISDFKIEDLSRISEYYTLFTIDEKLQLFELYKISIKPESKKHKVYDYKGDFINVDTSEFEFHYNERKEFIGIKNLDVARKN